MKCPSHESTIFYIIKKIESKLVYCENFMGIDLQFLGYCIVGTLPSYSFWADVGDQQPT